MVLHNSSEMISGLLVLIVCSGISIYLATSAELGHDPFAFWRIISCSKLCSEPGRMFLGTVGILALISFSFSFGSCFVAYRYISS